MRNARSRRRRSCSKHGHAATSVGIDELQLDKPDNLFQERCVYTSGSESNGRGGNDLERFPKETGKRQTRTTIVSATINVQGAEVMQLAIDWKQAAARRVPTVWLPRMQGALAALGLAAVTLGGVALHGPVRAMECVYIALILALSFWGNTLVSTIASCAAFLCLDYYFIPPLYTLTVGDPAAVLPLILFLGTALSVSALVTRLKRRTDQLEALYGDLAEREAKIRRLVDANVIGIFIWHLDGRIVDTNEAFLRMIGADRDELISGRIRWRDLTPLDWQAADEQRVAELRMTGTCQPYEKELFSKNGGRVPVLIGGALFDRASNQGVAFVVDLTDLKHAEDVARESDRRSHDLQIQLAHANRVASIGQLSASVTHEINQPLSAIMIGADTCVQALSTDPPNINAAQETASRMISNAKRACDVVARLRALFSKQEHSIETVDLNDAVREVIALSSSDLQKAGITLRCELADDLPRVCGDRIQLQQVILNLLLNAVDAMRDVHDRPKELLVRTQREGESASLSVQDTGVGFDAHNAEKLFDAFYTTKNKGMGIGLSVSRSIIENHHGRLWAMPNDGHGATFTFSIPHAHHVA